VPLIRPIAVNIIVMVLSRNAPARDARLVSNKHIL
jgi:hypothetical protein